MIHTSYIPYAELSKLNENDSVDEYIEYGGTLTKSPYKTLQASEEYQNTAIVGNILHSLEKSEDARRYGAAITELYEQNELKSVLNKMINKKKKKKKEKEKKEEKKKKEAGRKR